MTWCYSFSPGFTPLPKLAEFVKAFGADEILADAIAEAWLTVHFRRWAGDSPGFMALPFFAPLLHLFFAARGVPVPGASASNHATAWLRWLERDLAPQAWTYSQQPVSGYHGFEHSVFVKGDG